MYVSLLSFCSFVQESNACNHLFCNVIWSGPCNSSFCNSSLEQWIWERDECGGGSVPLLSASLHALLKCASSVWLTAWLGSCWQLHLEGEAASLILTCLSVYLFTHPSTLVFSLLPPPHPPLLISSNQLSRVIFIPPFPFFSSRFSFPIPPSPHPPVVTPTIRSHLSVCTSAIRASWQPNASHVLKLHTHTQANTHTQRLCPDKTAKEQITP